MSPVTGDTTVASMYADEKDDPKSYVYALIDPRTDFIRYIGVADRLGERMRGHRNSRKPSPKRAWLDELEALGLQPTVHVLETVARSEKFKAEARNIAAQSYPGHHLLNHAMVVSA